MRHLIQRSAVAAALRPVNAFPIAPDRPLRRLQPLEERGSTMRRHAKYLILIIGIPACDSPTEIGRAFAVPGDLASEFGVHTAGNGVKIQSPGSHSLSGQKIFPSACKEKLTHPMKKGMLVPTWV